MPSPTEFSAALLGNAPPARVQWLLLAAAVGLALMSYFVLVVHEATRRGDAMRMEQRITGQFGTTLAAGRTPAGSANRR